jgi:outer membrane protein assembly factor BamB
MRKLEEKDIKLLRGISTVAGIFTLVVALTMLFSYFQLKTMDPLENQTLVSLKDEYDKDPDNEVRAEQIRALDLMARKAYFSSRRQVETGSYLLLAGAIVFILCQRLIIGNEKAAPPVPGERSDQITSKMNYTKYLAGTVAVLTVAAIVSSFLLRRTLPDPSGRRSMVTERVKKKKEKKNDEIFVLADNFKPDSVNFPFFRGEDGRGIAGGTGYPLEWNGETGASIKWKISIPRYGKSSPVIWGDNLFVTGADQQTCEVYCINKNTGEIKWTASASGLSGEPATAPETDIETGIAAPTAATDGKSVCAIFANGNLICLDMEGNTKWAKNIGTPDNSYGYSCSLIIYEGILIIQFDSREKVAMMGFDAATGELKWETLRRGSASWASPVIATFNDQPQVIVNGNPEVSAYNPLTGEELWSIPVLSGDVAPSLAVNSTMVYAVTDYARLAAVKPGPEPSIVWEDNYFTSDVSSPVATNKFLFIATGFGDVACYDAVKGDTLWSHYFMDQFYASPVIAEDKVWMLGRSGVMYVVNAGPEFGQVAESPLGEPSDCTPAFSEKNIYIRGRNNLYCISAN